MTKIKVCFLAGSFNIGGVETSIYHLSKGLIPLGYEIIIIYFDGKAHLKNELNKIGCKVLYLRVGKILGNPIATIYNLYKLLLSEKPDIIHAHKPKAELYGGICGFLAGIPVLVSSKHGKDMLSKITFRLSFFLISGFYDRIVLVSPNLKKIMIRGTLFAKDRFINIGHGLDAQRFLDSSVELESRNILKKYKQDKSKLIGTISRLVPEKGIEFLIGAMAILKDEMSVNLLIVGDGPLYEKFNLLIKHNKLEERVFLSGWRSDSATVLKTLDVFLLPSLTESFPFVLLEAMASRVPIIASAVDGIPFILGHEKNALLVKPKNSKEIAFAVKRVLSDLKLANNLAENAFTTLNNYYTVRKMIDSFDRLYKGLLSKKNLCQK